MVPGRMSVFSCLRVLMFLILNADIWPAIHGSPHAESLYIQLMKDYNKYVRPVDKNNDALEVSMELKFMQIILVNEVSQVITSNVVVKQNWTDYKLKWSPADFGGITNISIPSENVWLPDIVLYNNAEGDYQITKMTKVLVLHTGMVRWNPPAIYKSYCAINVRYFPYDMQTCHMVFSSWTYDARLVNVRPSRGFIEDSQRIEVGMDLSEYKESIEWDIIEASAVREIQQWPYGPWAIITYQLTIRRKALFYTVNLVVPCVLISFLTIFVFYLPCDSGEKVTLCISILLSLTVFILLLAAIIPPTSENIPLLGRYLLFTLIMTCSSIALTIIVINVHFRNPATHKMGNCTRKLLLHWLPKLLLIERPVKAPTGYSPENSQVHNGRLDDQGSRSATQQHQQPMPHHSNGDVDSGQYNKFRNNSEVQHALNGVEFIMAHVRQNGQITEVVRDWKYAAFVLDRLFLIIFTMACLIGTGSIILDVQASYLNSTIIPKTCEDPEKEDRWICLFKEDDN